MFRQLQIGIRRTRALRAASLAAAVAGLAAAAALLTDARPVRAQGPLTLRTITIDGQFSDWDAVLANALQTTQDGDGSSAKLIANCGLYSTDRDCPQTGGAGNDFLKFAWTYDASNVYLYVERYGSTSNTVDLLFVADVNRDGKLDLVQDRVIHARWFGSSGTVSLDSWQYQPAAPGGDPIACVPTPPATRCPNAAGQPAAPEGFVDGYKLPGANVTRPPAPAAAGAGRSPGPGRARASSSSSPGRPSAPRPRSPSPGT